MAYNKKIEKNRAWYMTGCFFVFLTIVYLAFNILDGWTKYQESNKRLEASVSSFNELSKQYDNLKKEKSFEESTTGYEMQVRSKFDLNKPDENVIFIISDDVPQEIPEEKGFKRMFDTFKNFFN